MLFIKQVFILDPSFKDASLMQPKNTKITQACMRVSCRPQRAQRKTKAVNEAEWSCDQVRQQMIGCIAERWMVGWRMDRAQATAGDDEMEAERGIVGKGGKGGDRRTYLAQVIVPPGALLGTETNYTGWTYHRRPVAHFGLNTAVFLELNQIVERIPRTSARTQRETHHPHSKRDTLQCTSCPGGGSVCYKPTVSAGWTALRSVLMPQINFSYQKK